VSAAERAWRWCRRNPYLASALGSAAAALVAVAVVSLAFAAEQAAAKRQIGGLASDLEQSLARSNRLTADLKASLEVSGRRLAALGHERARTHFERGRAACERGEIGPGLLFLVESWRSAVAAGDSSLAHAARAGLSAWQHQASRLVRQFPHADASSVRCVALSPDGKTVATGGTDTTVRLWDAVTGQLIGSPLRHEGGVSAVIFSPDGRALLTAAGGAARVWDRSTGRPLGPPLRHRGTVRALALGPDGAIAVTAINDYTARLWDAATGQPIGSPLTHRGRINDLALGPGGKNILTGSEDGTARLWDAATGQPLCPPLNQRATSVAFSPDGRTVLTGGYDNVARLWDAATGRPIGPPLTHQGTVDAVAFSPDGKTILTGSEDNTARLWDAATGNPIGSPLPHQGPVFTVAFSSNGTVVLTGSQDGTARLWDAATGRPLATAVPIQGIAGSVALDPAGRSVLATVGDGSARRWDTRPTEPCGLPLMHRGRVNDVALAPDGKSVLTGSEDGTARLWDTTTGNAIGAPMPHQRGVSAVALGADGRAVLTGSEDGTARLWDIATGRPLVTLRGHRQRVSKILLGPDGKTILTGSSDTTARLWDAATGRPIGTPLRHRAAVTLVAFGSDGKVALTSSADGTARRWDAATGRPIGAPLVHRATSVAFSPDGKTMVTGSKDDCSARVWDTTSGKPTGVRVPLPGGVAWLAVSHDGKSVLTGSGDGTARCWDAATGRPIGAPVWHRAKLLTLDLSPDGTRILSGFGEHSVRVWDATATGQPLGPSLPHQATLRKVALCSDGRTAVTVTDGNQVLLWDVADLPDDLERLTDWVHVITGLVLDDRGELKDLDGAAWRACHDRLCSRGGVSEAEPRWRLDPVLFGPEPTARARAWAARNDWAMAETAFAEVVAARPLDAAVRFERARFYTARSLRAQAEEDYACSYALGNPETALVDTIVASEPLFERVVADAPDAAGPLWAKRGALRLEESRWDEAAAAFARELELLPEDRRWQSPRSKRALNLARSEQAYARLLELRPDDGQLWCARGRFHALHGRWDQAAADFARGITLDPPDSEECIEHACLRLIIGDGEGYRSFVTKLRCRAGRIDDSYAAYVLARTAVVAAAPVVEPEQAVRWANQAVRNSLTGWNLHCLGVAHYRAGRLHEAIKRLEESSATDWGEQGRMQNRLVLALAHHRLGHAAQSRALLDEVKHWWDGLEAARTEGAVTMPLTDWLPLQLFRREAEALILGASLLPAETGAR
jgi:WD40 repeat protein/tetratricopeptide (TPR) repeat protein